MTQLFAASAYVAAISLAIATEGARIGERFVEGPATTTSVLAKSDCARDCARSRDARPATDFAALTRTGSSETTATRSIAR